MRIDISCSLVDIKEEAGIMDKKVEVKEKKASLTKQYMGGLGRHRAN